MANNIRKAYDSFHKLPAGNYLFSRFLGLLIPYSGTICPDVQEVKEGYACISMKDRRQIRNHLHSVHAIAMINLAELTTGLALHYALPKNARAILTNLSIEYKKKGRGVLVCESHCDIVKTSDHCSYEILADVKDAKRHIVASAKAKWLVGSK